MLNARAAAKALSPFGRRRQAGMSIVELMVGVAVGLIVVAAAALLMTSQLIENRRLLTETQLQQDLRATADIMTRELRRVGARTEETALTMLWFPGSAGPQSNGMARDLSIGTDYADFQYDPGGTSATTFGYQLFDRVIQTNLGSSSGWHALTDRRVMLIDSLTFVRRNAAATSTQMPCAKPCPDGTSACWPRYEVRELDIVITARAARDSSVKRTVRSRVRLRNDHVLFSDHPTGMLACPA